MLKNVRICEAQTVFEIFVGFVGLHYKGVSSALPRLFSLVILLKIVEEKALGTRFRLQRRLTKSDYVSGFLFRFLVRFAAWNSVFPKMYKRHGL